MASHNWHHFVRLLYNFGSSPHALYVQANHCLKLYVQANHYLKRQNIMQKTAAQKKTSTTVWPEPTRIFLLFYFILFPFYSVSLMICTVSHKINITVTFIVLIALHTLFIATIATIATIVPSSSSSSSSPPN